MQVFMSFDKMTLRPKHRDSWTTNSNNQVQNICSRTRTQRTNAHTYTRRRPCAMNAWLFLGQFHGDRLCFEFGTAMMFDQAELRHQRHQRPWAASLAETKAKRMQTPLLEKLRSTNIHLRKAILFMLGNAIIPEFIVTNPGRTRQIAEIRKK